MASVEGRALRQQPGFACEECRRRKARCDRERPKCGFCSATGAPCVIVDKRQQRGPKKGQLNQMRRQIATLQSQLDEHFGSNSGKTGPEQHFDSSSQTDIIVGPDDYYDLQTNNLNEANLALTSTALATTTTTSSTPTSTRTSTSMSLDFAGTDLAGWTESLDWQDLEGGAVIPSNETGTVHPNAGQSLMAPGFKLTDLMRAELDQLYFDRVHEVCPIVQRERYLAWAGQESLTPARACLQSAMWTIAAAISVHWHYIVDHLCVETRRLLET